MRIATIHIVQHNEIGIPRQFTMELEILSDNIQTQEDIMDAIHAACNEYVATHSGKYIYENNYHNFNWADFEANIPGYFCVKHGFKRIQPRKTALELTVDWDEQLVTEYKEPKEE